MGGRAQRDQSAQQLRPDPGHGIRRLLRGDDVEPQHPAKRGLPLRERRHAQASAY